MTNEPQYIKITLFDQSTKIARFVSVLNNIKLSQLREMIQKQFELKQFKFINDGAQCSKATQKHTTVAIYMKSYYLINIISQVREQPKKQSKIIEKQSKRLTQSSSIAQRHIANTRQFLERQRLHQQKQKMHQQRMAMLQSINNNDNKTDSIKVNPFKTKKNSSIEALKQAQQKLQPNKQLTTSSTNQTTNHFKWTRQNIEYCQLKYGIELSENGQGIDHQYKTINIQELTKCDWPNVQWLGLYGCGVDDKGWKLLVEKASAFSQLKILGLKHNKITTIRQGDLQQFRTLRLIEFGTQDGCNPLTQQSKEYLKKFKQQNRHIKVKFRF